MKKRKRAVYKESREHSEQGNNNAVIFALWFTRKTLYDVQVLVKQGMIKKRSIVNLLAHERPKNTNNADLMKIT